MIISKNSLLGWVFISISLSCVFVFVYLLFFGFWFFFFKFWLKPLFGTHSSVNSFCLILCVFVSIISLVVFCNLGKVTLCRRHPLRPSSTLPSSHQTRVPSVGSVALVGLTIVGMLIGRASPWPHLLPCPVLCSVCWPFWSAGPVLGQLALAAKRARSGAGSPMGGAKSMLGCLTSWVSWDWVGPAGGEVSPQH